MKFQVQGNEFSFFRHLLLETGPDKKGILVFGYDNALHCNGESNKHTYDLLCSMAEAYGDLDLIAKDLLVKYLDFCRSDHEGRLEAIKVLRDNGAKNIIGIYWPPPIQDSEKDLSEDTRRRAERFIADPPTIEEGFSLLLLAVEDE